MASRKSVEALLAEIETMATGTSSLVDRIIDEADAVHREAYMDALHNAHDYGARQVAEWMSKHTKHPVTRGMVQNWRTKHGVRTRAPR